jgi:hypothetical protein
MNKSILILLLAACFLCPMAAAASPPGSGNLESGPYGVSGTITTPNPCIVPSGEKVLFAATSQIVLKPGFHAVAGSNFRAVIGSYSAISPETDSDIDNLADWLELLYFGLLTETGSGDYDGDGVMNGIEFSLGSNPTSLLDRPAPGTSYSYDALGRIIKIIRVQ